jgi:NTE family protein
MHALVKSLSVTVLALGLAAQAIAEPARPKIGLVLGGGGARGAAHIGVLELLEELRVPVDCVPGTSMGALVAGAYAAGLPPAQMRKLLGQADWADMFNDLPAYDEINLHRKQILRNFIPGSETGVTDKGISYQTGGVDGQKIKLFFNQLVGASRGERLIEKLPLPLSIIATDIGTGERVVFREGSLTSAMRASMSVPGLLSPVDLGGRKLVDGGLVDNVPIGEARERCQPDVVIAVNVGSPLMKAEDVGSLLSVSAQMVNILTEQNVTRSLATLKSSDIYIKPDLGTITAGDFGRNAEAADRGRAAAETVRGQLARLSATPAAYAAWRSTIDSTGKPRPVVDEIQIAGLVDADPAVVERHLRIKPGDELYSDRLNEDLNRSYGDGYYQSVDYQLLRERDRNILRITPVEKPWGPDYMRFGLNLEADTSNASSFLLRAAYHKTLMNQLGGEFLAAVDFGTYYGVRVDLYQPLDPGQRFFVEAMAQYRSDQRNIYQNDERVAQYKTTSGTLGAWLGMNIGILGQAKAGWLEERRDFERDIGSPQLPDATVRFGGWAAALSFDQLNRLYFPTDGWATNLRYFDTRDGDYSRVDFDAVGAYSLGRTVLNARTSYSGAADGILPFYDAARIGGPLNLSAFAPGQVVGDDITYIGLRGEQIIGKFPLGLRGDLRLGVALEAAHVGRYFTETNLADLDYLNSAAVYFGSETPFGPLYIGYGRSSEGNWNAFFTIGVR